MTRPDIVVTLRLCCRAIAAGIAVVPLAALWTELTETTMIGYYSESVPPPTRAAVLLYWLSALLVAFLYELGVAGIILARWTRPSLPVRILSDISLLLSPLAPLLVVRVLTEPPHVRNAFRCVVLHPNLYWSPVIAGLTTLVFLLLSRSRAARDGQGQA